MTTPPTYDEVWTTRDGERLKVSEMSEQHVRAALNMVIRRARYRRRVAALRAKLMEQIRAGIDADEGHWGDV